MDARGEDVSDRVIPDAEPRQGRNLKGFEDNHRTDNVTFRFGARITSRLPSSEG